MGQRTAGGGRAWAPRPPTPPAKTASKGKSRKAKGTASSRDGASFGQSADTSTFGRGHLPALMSMSGGVHDEVSSHLSGNDTAGMMIKGIVSQGQQNTGGEIKTDASITDATADTVHKVNNASGLGGNLRDGLRLTQPGLSDGLNLADHLMNGQKKSQSGEVGDTVASKGQPRKKK